MGTAIESVVLEVDEVAPAEAFCAALGVGDLVLVREGDAPSSGFRGFTLSLVCGLPDHVDALLRAAVAAGARILKPAKKSLWGYGAIVEGPDGTIWKFATSTKKHAGDDTAAFDDLVVLLGVEDVKAARQFYVDRGLTVNKSYGGKYADFEAPDGGITLALYPRRAAAKEAGVDVAGSGSHRIALRGTTGAFIDPDGFVWESTADSARGRG